MSDEERAAELIEAYESRFGAPHVLFALHAAVPIALTPDLALQVWGAFRVDRTGETMQIPWIAAADLLLSPLVSEAAPELYTMSPTVRRALLAKLSAAPSLGEARLREVATLLLKIGEAESRDANRSVAVRGETQRWTALSILRPEESARSIGAAMNEAGSDPGRWVRFEALLDQLADASESHAALRSLAAGMAELGRGRSAALREHVERHGSTVTAGGTPIAIVPGEALSRLNPRRAEAPQAVGPKAEEGDSPREIPPLSGLRVRVVGTSTLPLDPSDQRVAEQLGEALAQRGHVLITGGEAGIEATAAESFARALGDSRAVWARLTHVTVHPSQGAFSGGTRITGTLERSVEMSDIVVRIGIAAWPSEVLNASLKLDRPRVELRFRDTDTAALNPPTVTEPDGASTKSHVAMGFRAKHLLGVHGGISRHRDIARAMAVIELARRENILGFARYSAELIEVALTEAQMQSRPGSDAYLTGLLQDAGIAAGLQDAFKLGFNPSRRSEGGEIGRWAAKYPEWLWFDRERLIGGGIEVRPESRQALDEEASRHCQALLADELMGVFSQPAGKGPDEAQFALIRRVREVLEQKGESASRSGEEGGGERNGYLNWLRPIIVYWGNAPLQESPEWSERAPSIVGTMSRLLTGVHLGRFVDLLLLSRAPEERVAGYLCLLGGNPEQALMADMRVLATALNAELLRASQVKDQSGTLPITWSLLWQSRALIHLWRSTSAGSSDLAEWALGSTGRLVLGLLLRIYWWWDAHPAHDLQGHGLNLIASSLRRWLPASSASWLSAHRNIGRHVCWIEGESSTGGRGILVAPGIVLTTASALVSPGTVMMGEWQSSSGGEATASKWIARFPRWSDEDGPAEQAAVRSLLAAHDDLAILSLEKTADYGDGLSAWLEESGSDAVDVGAAVYIVSGDDDRSIHVQRGNVVSVSQDADAFAFCVSGASPDPWAPVFSIDGALLGFFRNADLLEGMIAWRGAKIRRQLQEAGALQRMLQNVHDRGASSSALQPALSGVPTQRGVMPLFEHGYALIVGVGGDLHATVADALDLASVLRDPLRGAYKPENVILLTEKATTRDGVLAGLRKLGDMTRGDPRATLLIYFSGLGIVDGHKTSAPKYYLGTHGYEFDRALETCVSADEFSMAIDAIPALRKVIFLDCSHSGGIGKAKGFGPVGTAPSKNTLEQFAGGIGTIVIASCSEEQQSYQYPGSRNSLFTEVLLGALSVGDAKDGLTYMFGVLNEVTKRVKARGGDKYPQEPLVAYARGVTDFPICRGQWPASTPPGKSKGASAARAVYVSYALADRAYGEEFVQTLRTYERTGAFRLIVHEIVPGVVVAEAARRKVEEAAVIVCLLSADYFSDNRTARLELPAIEARGEEAFVFPVQLRAFAALDIAWPWASRFPRFPAKGTVTASASRAELWAELADRILDSLRARSVYVSYALADRAYGEELVQTLRTYKGAGVFRLIPNEVDPDKVVDQEVRRKIQEAGVIVCLLSADYFSDKERTGRLERAAIEARGEGAIVFPVQLRAFAGLDVAWPWASRLQRFPAKGTIRSSASRAELWAELADRILDSLRARSVYVSYALADKAYGEELVQMLGAYERAGVFRLIPHEVAPGKAVELEVRRKVEEAGVIVCLLSADYFADNRMSGVEQPAIEARGEGAILLPVQLRAFAGLEVAWPSASRLPRFPATGSVAASASRSEVWAELSEQILDIFRGGETRRESRGAMVAAPEARIPPPARSGLSRGEREILKKQIAAYEPGIHDKIDLIRAIRAAMAEEVDPVRFGAYEKQIARLERQIAEEQAKVEQWRAQLGED